MGETPTGLSRIDDPRLGMVRWVSWLLLGTSGALVLLTAALLLLVRWDSLLLPVLLLLVFAALPAALFFRRGSAFSHEVTLLKRENARLWEAERRGARELDVVIDHMSDGVIVTDRDGRVVRCNEAAVQLLGEIAVGEPLPDWSEFGSGDGGVPPDAGMDAELSGRGLESEGLTQREIIVRRGDGSVGHLSVDACPVLDETDYVVRGVTVVHDLTAAREIDQLKGDFLAIAAHELKTPLTSLKGYAQMLLSMGADDLTERQRRALGVIDRQADRVNRMVEQFLLVAEIRSGRLALEPEPVELSRLVEASCENLKRWTSGCEIKCTTFGPLEVMADPRSLEVVLSNVVHNAFKFSEQGSTIEVEVSERESEATVSVRDGGVGIPRDKQAYVFEPFFQVQPGTAAGIGLGLYISQQLVLSQGGRMWMDSQEGAGSTFHFAFPIPSPSADRPT